jgi:N-methylhydantoinase A
MTRFGVDVGGTFTDLIAFDPATGRVTVAKGPTTPVNPEKGVGNVLEEVKDRVSIPAADLFFHGTTVALNAVLERKGARVALLTTAGFRDVLEVRRGVREEFTDVLWRAEEPLVPRRRRFPVGERIAADGEVLTPIDLEDVERAAAEIREAEVDAVAVAFLNAYANPTHELAAAAALADAGYAGEISLSHLASGEYREYERTSTTVIDAYVRPRLSTYFGDLLDELGSVGFDGTPLVMRAGGGAMSLPEARVRPFETIQSGVVAGAGGAGSLCKELGIDRAITADVGGTSFDAAMIVDHQPQVRYEGSVAGMPVQTEWIDVRSVGAGGGSLVKVDQGGLLKVGPESAGARPGPICYGHGGTIPTATDAAAVLGMLGRTEIAGGLHLQIDDARDALAKVGQELGLDVENTARGVLEILAANMAGLLRQIFAEYGQDPRSAAMVSFGGAGPLFASLIAKEMGMTKVVVPRYPGNFSAWSLLLQDISRSASATVILPVDGPGLAAARDRLSSMFGELEARSEDGASAPAREFERVSAVDLRYVGQEFALTIPVGEDDTVEALTAAFTSRYEAIFDSSLEQPLEVVAVRATLRCELDRPSTASEEAVLRSADERTSEAYSFNEGRRMDFRLVERDSLPTGARLAGPAILLEATATTYLDAGTELEVSENGALIIESERHD